jgi:hypothetical protein
VFIDDYDDVIQRNMEWWEWLAHTENYEKYAYSTAVKTK